MLSLAVKQEKVRSLVSVARDKAVFPELTRWLTLGLLGSYALWWSVSVTKPLRNDDVLWTYTGQAIVSRGVPLIWKWKNPKGQL